MEQNDGRVMDSLFWGAYSWERGVGDKGREGTMKEVKTKEHMPQPA